MYINRHISRYNNSSRYGSKVKYLVIHYVGEVSSARNNCIYFAGGNRQASAHFFVDNLGIWQSVEESRSAWHCGGGLQGSGGHTLHRICTNSNSLGIEMCLKKDAKGRLYVDKATMQNTAELVQYLMKKYRINPVNVVRHYDVTGKLCPNAYTYYDFSGTLLEISRWNSFRWHLVNDKREVAVKPASVSKPKGAYPYALPTVLPLGARYNARNKDVRKVQGFLTWAGYRTTVTGLYNIWTVRNTKKFQGKVGLKKDGIWGPKTNAAAKAYRK